MKPIKRKNKINQQELLELDRQAKERILERHLQAALAQANITKQVKVGHQPILAQAV